MARLLSAPVYPKKVVEAEKLTERASTDGVHSTGLEVHQDGAGHVAAAGSGVVVHENALQLKVGVKVGPGGPCLLEVTCQNLAPIWLVPPRACGPTRVGSTGKEDRQTY